MVAQAQHEVCQEGVGAQDCCQERVVAQEGCHDGVEAQEGCQEGKEAQEGCQEGVGAQEGCQGGVGAQEGCQEGVGAPFSVSKPPDSFFTFALTTRFLSLSLFLQLPFSFSVPPASFLFVFTFSTSSFLSLSLSLISIFLFFLYYSSSFLVPNIFSFLVHQLPFSFLFLQLPFSVSTIPYAPFTLISTTHSSEVLLPKSLAKVRIPAWTPSPSPPHSGGFASLGLQKCNNLPFSSISRHCVHHVFSLPLYVLIHKNLHTVGTANIILNTKVILSKSFPKTLNEF